MTIDWLTVAAQALNFLVLVYLLKRFLYGPVVRAMARRDDAIAARLREAETRQREADAEAVRHREAREAVESQRERLLTRAREDADDLRRTLEKTVREETDELRARWRADLQREQATFLADIRRHAAEQFEVLARKALADLASAELEAQMARVLIERLGALDEGRTALARAAAGEGLRVRTAFELAPSVKRQLTGALHEALGAAIEVAYERVSDVVCGLEIRAGGESFAWSLESHLDTLEQRLADRLGEGRR